MAKLLLIQTLFLTICLFALVSGTIQKKKDFRAFIVNKVAPTFRAWAWNVNRGEQFAVLMLTDTDQNWNTFKLSPEPSSAVKSMVQPAADMRDNYVAVLPGNNMHSEQRIYEEYLEDMWNNYKQKHGTPKAMVLYSWIVPCTKQSCPSQGTTGCTSHTIQALKKYTKETEVVVAFTTKGGVHTDKACKQLVCGNRTRQRGALN